ncbi:MAG TPA: DUF1501 domain-containing protein [Bryobacteraceae bacterium]|nr:DUF1501 domain-containing protein [Bryobacteraceae bacterium]
MFHKPKPVSRRDLLFRAGEGIGGLALAYLLSQDGLLAADGCQNPPGVKSPFTPKAPHFKARARNVISLFMCGGVSAVDTFDPKPALEKYHGQPLPGEGEVQVQQGYPGPIMRSPYKFRKYGQSGIEISQLFPNIGSVVDDIALIRSAVGRSNDHSISHFEWTTGALLPGSPSYGAWVAYGLGTANQNLPAFVVIFDTRGGPYNGPNNWGAGYLPAAYQGTAFRSVGDPILDLRPPAEHLTVEEQRARLDLLAWLNQQHEERYPGVSELSARIASYELAYRMQGCAPETVDLSSESSETKRLYGLDQPVTEPFGRQCLMARRLIERGVRFVQLWNGAYVNDTVDTWDAHNSIVDNHGQHAAEVDKPIAGLLADLKRRGLLDETLVVWHTEFGRMPISQRGVGRDHNPNAFSIWMAGAGIKGGQVIGQSDDFGYKVVNQPISVHDFHATVLALLGIDHKRLTYFFNGRHMRLTDVHGEVIPQIAG